ncbi:MAG: hypothetical protein Q9173_006051 [Seirophora scorigena]
MDPCVQSQNHGQVAYRRKDYHAALDFFNSAIFQENNPAIDVLDNRAATYEKLGDLHAALKDGRRMITDHKTSCVTQGLSTDWKNSSIVGETYDCFGNLQLLRRLHDNMFWSYTTDRAKDPLTVLPAEIVEMILSSLNFRQIVSLIRVSSKWQEYLISMPILWKSLDFSVANASISPSAIQKYLGFSKGNATHVIISRSVGQIPRILPYVFRVCRKLDTLQIDGGSPNDSLVKAASIARNLKTLILNTCSEFHTVNSPRLIRNPWSSPMPRLHTLTLKLDPLLEQLTEIRELTLDNWSSSTNIPTPGKIDMDHLHHLRLCNFFGGGVSLQSLPRLRFLQLDGVYSLIRQSSIGDFDPDPRIAGLVELLVPRATFRADELMRILGPNNRDLRRLSLPHAVWLEEADLDILVSSGMLDPILDLDLSGTKVTDEVIELLAPRARQLRSIRLGSTRITGISVKALVARSDCQLLHLDIRSCPNISKDAIDLARKKVGLKVFSSNVMSNHRTKKVRYE